MRLILIDERTTELGSVNTRLIDIMGSYVALVQRVYGMETKTSLHILETCTHKTSDSQVTMMVTPVTPTHICRYRICYRAEYGIESKG